MIDTVGDPSHMKAKFMNFRESIIPRFARCFGVRTKRIVALVPRVMRFVPKPLGSSNIWTGSVLRGRSWRSACKPGARRPVASHRKSFAPTANNSLSKVNRAPQKTFCRTDSLRAGFDNTDRVQIARQYRREFPKKRPEDTSWRTVQRGIKFFRRTLPWTNGIRGFRSPNRDVRPRAIDPLFG